MGLSSQQWGVWFTGLRWGLLPRRIHRPNDWIILTSGINNAIAVTETWLTSNNTIVTRYRDEALDLRATLDANCGHTATTDARQRIRVAGHHLLRYRSAKSTSDRFQSLNFR
jgi:hypothetical protein